MKRLRDTVDTLVRFERSRLAEREKSLAVLEVVATSVDIPADLKTFVRNNTHPDHTHAYEQALVLLDWDWERTHSAALPPPPLPLPQAPVSLSLT